MDIHGKSMDMDMGVKFYSHGKPEGTLGEKVQNHIMEWRQVVPENNAVQQQLIGQTCRSSWKSEFIYLFIQFIRPQHVIV